MNELLTYLVKAAIIQSVLLVCYRLLMQRDTFYKMTRFCFMGGLLFSYIAPFIRFDFRILPPVQNSVPQLSQLVQPATVQGNSGISDISYFSETYRNMEQLPQTSLQWWQQYSFTDILTVVFIAGIAFMLIRFIRQYLSLGYLKAVRKHQYQTYNILNVDLPIKPFSFGKRIYVNPRLHNERELDEIIRHELVHIRQYHSIDIIVAAINRSIFWWNPFAWILNGDVRNNLEYIVDNEMLQSGINRKHYQYHLLNINQLIYNNNTVNYFNFSNFKKRIEMMNKEKTQPVYKIKWLLLPLVVAAILMSFNMKRAIATNVVFAVNSEIIEPEPVAVDDTVVSAVPAATAFAATEIDDIVGNKAPMNIMVNVGLDPSKSVVITQGCDSIDIADADLLIIINGKESNGDEFLKLESIRSISVLINEAAVEAYGDKGKNGVIVVETHSNATAELDNQAAELDKQAAELDKRAAELDKQAAELDKQAAEWDRRAAELDKQAAEWDRRAAELDKQAAEFDKTLGTGSQIIINGKKSNPVVLSQLNPDDIESIGSVGRSGKNNVFTIGTKDNVIIPESDETSDTKCLFIIDGKEASKDDLSKLETNVIKSLNILKSKTAIKEYGDKGKNGVIIVKTK